MRKKFVLHCQVISPHHLSFMRAIARTLGEENVRYLYTEPLTEERRRLGWYSEAQQWIRNVDGSPDICAWLENCDVLISSVRVVDLFRNRIGKGLITIYMSERWFKPIPIGRLLLPGFLRLLSPRYFYMALCFRKMLRAKNTFFYLPIGVWAARDMAKVCGWYGSLKFERKPGGKIWSGARLLDKFKLWAYFVESSESTGSVRPSLLEKRVLWLGRCVKVKRVTDIVAAVNRLSDGGCPISLDIFGHGDAEEEAKLAAGKRSNIKFFDPVPIDDVRKIMKQHDVYVFSSNGMEGWGAVVNEAMEEGMSVIGTYEAGASATLLPDDNLYHAGDVDALTCLLGKHIPVEGIKDWSCKNAEKEILRIISTNNF